MSYFSRYFPKARDLAEKLFNSAELGFKEFQTSKIIENELKRIDPKLKAEHYLKTGLKVVFDNHRKKTIGVIAEMDALYQPKHFNADPETGAAHACGHYTQVVIALAMINELVKSSKLKDFDTNLAFIFTPSEEFVDLDWRQKQKDEGKLTYYGGKQEAIKQGVFDDIDYCVSVHAIGEQFKNRTIELNCDLAGFNFKYFDFYGKASHAAFAPEAGVNAQSIATLFTTALAMQRQQLKDPNRIRFNPVMISENTESINVIPDHVKMGSDLRFFNVNYAQTIMQHFDNAAKGCALALGGQVEINTQVGYLPLHSNRDMNALVKKTFEADDRIPDLIDDRGYTMAAGDIGDVGFLIPTIQIGYGGWEGTIHGSDFKLIDPEFVLKIFPEFVFNSVLNISHNLGKVKSYRHSKEEYLQALEGMEK